MYPMGREAPLFPVALVFALGCGLGLWSGVDAAGWCTLLVLWSLLGAFSFWRTQVGIAWEDSTETYHGRLLRGLWLAVLFVILGATLGGLRVQWVATDDLRQLDVGKRDPGTEWRGVIVSNPVTRASGRTDFFLQVEAWRPLRLDALLDDEAPWHPASGRLFVEINPRGASRAASQPEGTLGPRGPYFYGQQLQITGGLDFPRGAMNPGQFDWRGYLQQRDVFYKLRANPEAIQVLSHSAGYPWTRAAAWAQRWTLERLRLGIEDDPVVCHLIGGMLLGYTQEIPEDLKTAFYNTETYHIFAVSGQNVGVLMLLGLLVLRLTGLTWWRWAWLVAPLLVFYVLVTGNQPSAVRALCMALLVMLAWKLERPVSILNLWSLAVLVVLGWDPQLLGDLGFQLSFAVVLALILISPPLYTVLMRPWSMDPFIPRVLVTRPQRRLESSAKYACGLVAGSTAAWLGALPFMLMVFHRVSWIGLLANLWVVPLASLVVVVGTISVVASMIATPLAVAVNCANWAVVRLLIAGVVWLNAVPGAYVYVASTKVEARPAGPELICASAGASTLGLLRHGERAWLINTGNEFGWLRVMNPLRQFYGVNQFDGVFLTEPSTSRNGAISLLAREHLTQKWFLSDGRPTSTFAQTWQMLRKNERERMQATMLRAGEEIDLGEGLVIRVLSPLPQQQSSRVADRAAVLLISYGDYSVLWASRIGFGTELELMRAYPGLSADVLVQAAHGSEVNRTGQWLTHLAPQAIILSAPPNRWRSQERLDLTGFSAGEAPVLYHQRETGAVTLRWTEAGISAQPFIRPTPHAPKPLSNESPPPPPLQ